MPNIKDKVIIKFRRAYYRQKIKKESRLISQNKLQKRIKRVFPDVKIIPLDGKYRLVYTKTIKDVLKKTNVDKEIYSLNFSDCENSSFLLASVMAFNYKTNSVGIVLSFSGKHSFNLAVTRDDVLVIEPQQDAVWPASQNKNKGKKYKINGEIILI